MEDTNGDSTSQHCTAKNIGPSQQNNDDGVLVHLEPSRGKSDGNDDDSDCSENGPIALLPPSWSIEYVQTIEKKAPIVVSEKSNDDTNNIIPSVMDVGMQMVRGTLDGISKKLKKKNKGSANNNKSVLVNPTPIQLKLWPALLHSFQSKVSADDDDEPSATVALNVVGIAPTGTGKTMAYATPILSHCVRTLLCQLHPAHAPPSSSSSSSKQLWKHSTMVHGLVLVPTRELAIQVSKEFKVGAKIANKYLSKYCAAYAGMEGKSETDGADAPSLKVKSIAVYGGVDIGEQITTLLGKGMESSSSSGQISRRSLVVAATAGRLLDILKKTDANDQPITVASAFANLQAIVFDEADRIAVNADMASQVDEIISIVNTEKRNRSKDDDDGGVVVANCVDDVVSCLVSATLPEKAKEMCDKWVPRSRIIVKVDNVKVGGRQDMKMDSPDNDTTTTKDRKCNGGDDGEGSPNESSSKTAEKEGKKRSSIPANLDLGSIPSNIVQTLHVCSPHKKPKKLLLTLQRIYSPKKGAQQNNGRYSVNNRLCIVFFAQIKTVKFASKFLIKEGLRCVELYGSLNQSERDKRLLEFKCGKTPILLATDVAARGLHISNVHFVVNYDFPGSLDQYVHRCGRAGRKHALSGGDAGSYPPTVYSFFPREFPSEYADAVVDLLKASSAWVDPNLLALTKRNKTLDNGTSKTRRKRKRGKKDKPADDAENSKTAEGQDKNNDDDDDDREFSFLGQIKLKRASHVSDAEDSDDNDSS